MFCLDENVLLKVEAEEATVDKAEATFGGVGREVESERGEERKRDWTD